jgi:hypothetical protein
MDNSHCLTPLWTLFLVVIVKFTSYQPLSGRSLGSSASSTRAVPAVSFQQFSRQNFFAPRPVLDLCGMKLSFVFTGYIALS